MSNTPLNRQEEILRELHAHLRSRTHWKRLTRVVVPGAGLVAVVYVASLSRPSATREARDGGFIAQGDARPNLTETGTEPIAAPVPVTTAAGSHVTVRIAGSEPLPATPCDTGHAARVCILSDDQLLAALAEAGRPSGLVRTGGTAFVVPLGPSPQSP